ncbi:MAG: pitrilysin family protein [Pirellulaceae bacterium]|nr:pitrilysin family protein [Pirellulaceae bacterium]
MSRLMQYVLSLVCFAWISEGVLLKAEDALPKKLHSIEGIEEYQLENGVQILLFPDSSKPVVTVSMTVFVGSRHEGYGEAGMAHLLEHMLFKGTENHPAIPKALKDRGAQFNGTTWYDRTNYYETLSADGDNLEFAIRLEADRLVNSKVRGEDLATEMSVVRSEFESGENDPQRVLQQRMMSTAYQWHNYGKSTIGNRSDIERVPVNALRDFYRKYYRPDNVMVVVAGKFESANALSLLSKYFGILDRPKVAIDKTYTMEPAQDGERTTVVRRVGDSQLVGAAYHIPSGSDPSYQAVDILSMVLADEPSGRLYKNLIETKKATSMHGGSYALHDPGLIFFLAEVPKDKSLEDARTSLLATLEELAKEPVEEIEVQRAKTQILKARELRAANPSSLAIELSEWAAQGDWRLYFLNRDRVESVTAADVQAAANQYLTRNNRTVGLFIPADKAERIEVPEQTDYRALLADYQGREEIQQGEVFDPTPKNIESRTVRGELDSGISYSFLPKKTRGSTVNVSLNLRFGDEKSLFGKTAACEMLGSMLMRGSSEYNFQQIKDRLDELVASVAIDSRPQLLQVKIQTKRANLPNVLAVVSSVLRHPTFPEKEFDVLRDDHIVSIETQLSDPQALAPITVTRALNPYKRGDLRYQPSIEEELEDFRNLKLIDVVDVYKRMLGGTSGEVSIVGDFEPEGTIEVLDELLSDWKPTVPYHRATNTASTNHKRNVTLIETPDKPNSVFYASQQYAIRDDDSDYPALIIGNYVFGGGALSSRIGDRVRQREGLSYGVGSGLTAHPIDERCSLTIYAIANPVNRDKVMAAIDEELEKIIEHGITQEELGAARDGYLKSLQVGRSSDGRLAETLSQNLFAGRTMEYFQGIESKIRKLKIEDVNKTIKEYFDPDGLVIAMAGDFASVKSKAAVTRKKANGEPKPEKAAK